MDDDRCYVLNVPSVHVPGRLGWGTYAAVTCQGTDKVLRYGIKDMQRTPVVEQE